MIAFYENIRKEKMPQIEILDTVDSPKDNDEPQDGHLDISCQSTPFISYKYP